MDFNIDLIVKFKTNTDLTSVQSRGDHGPLAFFPLNDHLLQLAWAIFNIV